MREAYIGVDVGTLSARAGVFDSIGQLIASARRPIAIWREPGEIVQRDGQLIADVLRGPVAQPGQSLVDVL